jgi:hypothetical protein
MVLVISFGGEVGEDKDQAREMAKEILKMMHDQFNSRFGDFCGDARAVEIHDTIFVKPDFIKYIVDADGKIKEVTQ